MEVVATVLAGDRVVSESFANDGIDSNITDLVVYAGFW